MFLTINSIPKDVEIQKNLTSIRISEWLKDDVFQLRWWILLLFLIFTTYIWWKTINKLRLHEILLYTGITTILTMAFIEYGEELILWDYPTDIIPIFPTVTSFNLLILPFIYSLLYQFFATWKKFLLASIITTAIFCFLFEPLCSIGGFYQLINWKYYYSFPILILMSLLSRLAVKKILIISKKHSY